MQFILFRIRESVAFLCTRHSYLNDPHNRILETSRIGKFKTAFRNCHAGSIALENHFYAFYGTVSTEDNLTCQPHFTDLGAYNFRNGAAFFHVDRVSLQTNLKWIAVNFPTNKFTHHGCTFSNMRAVYRISNQP